MFRCIGLLFGVVTAAALSAQSPSAGDAVPSLNYLDAYAEPYYPGTHFPKLITPQWVGEPGVDAVVTLAIDDMRDTAKYESYLRPILEHLKKIDGRAPVSIMSCRVDPDDPQLQRWLDEGLSIEVHTVDHPCPCLQGGNFATAKSTYDRCVDMMAAIPGNQPVAFRTPCCDSRNTPSPRLWQEIFSKRTENGHFLQADSSVFNVFTAEDPALPRDLVLEGQGKSRFRKYIPFPSFVNTIENYPYPYVIGKSCWQFPCMVPSDWEAQNLHQPNNPKTVADMQAALDATVIKQGMFNLVFHPHGWIRNDQVIELIEYAQQKYGQRVKFLNFKECVDRLNQNLLLGQPLRAPDDGGDHGVRLVDLNQDGYLDLMIGNEQRKVTRLWQGEAKRWRDLEQPIQITGQGVAGGLPERVDRGVKFGRLNSRSTTSLLVSNEDDQAIYEFTGDRWTRNRLPESLRKIRTSVGGVDRGVRLRDLDGDGISEILLGHPAEKRILKLDSAGDWRDVAALPFAIVDADGQDNGARFVDLDSDGHDDLIVSNGVESGIRLFDVDTGGFTRIVKDGSDIPLIVRGGTNNGVWFAANHLWVQNEDTHRLPDGVDRRSFRELLGTTEPGPRAPDLSRDSIEVRPGFTVELMAAEPLVMDPIALDWGADGKLWVVEMADYPLGMDDRGEPGGRVRYLEDTDGDGSYDQSTLFLDKIAYPTGVIAWRDGVIVSAAPNVFFAADRDGDGKAEVREDLYRGFGEGNQQHRVNGFQRGLDHWLYLANGDSGGTVESLKTGEKVQLGGQDLRIRPADGALDLLTGRTQFGRHRDDHGNWFGCSNPTPVRHFVLEDRYLRRNPHIAPPPARRDIARGDNTQLFPISRVLSHWSGYKPPPPGSGHKFTSACSTMVYRDRLFGEDFAANTFTCEPVHNAVHRRRLVPNGVTFASVRPEDEMGFEFLASTDSWFRPTTVTTGPDGALWITDMYRLVIEHPEWIDDERERELFLRAGHDRGRIYRVYPTNNRPRSIPRIDKLDLKSLVDLLASPNGRIRDLAQQLLVERSEPATVPLLERMVRQSAEPLGRLHALCTLDAITNVQEDLLRSALRDESPTVRRHAIRICELNIEQPETRTWEALEQCVDSEPHVQLQLAYSLGEWTDPQATDLLARLAERTGEDAYIRAAVVSSLNLRNMNDFYQAIADDSSTRKRFRPLILEMAIRMKQTTMVNTLVWELTQACDDDPSVDHLSALTEALRALKSHGMNLDDSFHAPLSCLGAEVVSIAIDRNTSLEQRVAAVGFLPFAAADFRTDVLALLDVTEPVQIQIAAADALVDEEASTVLQRFPILSPAVRSAILDRLLSRESTSLRLLDSLRDEVVDVSAIGSAYRKKLLDHPSRKVSAAAVKLLGGLAVPAERRAVMERYRTASPTAGDRALGRTVFIKNCAACHRVKEVGHVVGPDLAAIKDRSPQAMLTAILDPNAAVEDKYRSYSVLTIDGVAEAGIIAGESSTAIELLLQDGKQKTILRDDIELLQGTGKSLMPEEMEKAITPAEMNHLLAFLNDVGPAPKEFTGNQPEIVRATKKGVLELSATNCRIYGDQIRFEPHYNNIGYWSRGDDQVQWTLEVDRPGRYEVWLDYACPDHTAGNSFLFSCGDQTITGKIEGTGTWDDYRQVKLGTIELAATTTVASFRAAGDIRKWFLDLRAITLKPE